jgi:hypothetical protein
MVWIKLIIVILNIALSSSVSYFIFKKNKLKRIILFGLLIILLIVVSSKYLIPEIERLLVTKDIVEKELQKEVHFSKAIKDNAPEIYNEMVTDILKLIKSGKNKEDGLIDVRIKFTSIMKNKLIKSSNETVLNYLKTAISEINDLQKKNSNVCYDFVQKGYAKGVDSKKIFSMKTKKLKFKLIELILKTYDKNYKLPLKNEVAYLTTPIYFKLFKNHGIKTLLEIQQKNPRIDQKKACSLIKDLFVEVSKLNEDDSAKVTRYIISTI